MINKITINRYILFSIIFICSFLFLGNANALSVGRVTYDGKVLLRTGPGDNYQTSNELHYGDSFIIMNSSTIKGSGCTNGWYKFNYNGSLRYICSGHTSTSASTIRVNYSSGVNLRTGAGINYSTYKKVKNDKLLTLSSTKKINGKGCFSGWYKVYYNSKNLYICSTYIKNYNSSSNVIVSNIGGVNLRKSNSTSSQKIASLKYGESLTLSDKTKYKGTGCSSGYYKVFYKGYIRNVCSSYVYNKTSSYVVNIGAGVPVYSSTTNLKKVNTIPYGSPVIVIGTTKYKGNNCSNGYYKISLNNTNKYVCSSYITNTNNITNTTTKVNIRKGAGTNYAKTTSFVKNAYVVLASTSKFKGTGCSAGWYKLNYNGTTGYICSSYTELGKPTNTSTSNSTSNNTSTKKTITKIKTSAGYYYTTNTWNYKIKENYGYVRASASTSSSIKDTIYLGTEVNVTGTAKATSGCSAGWYKISYYKNRTGYICKSLIDKKENVTKANASYCNTLVKNGFPSSYCPYLSYLHSKYPNWVFKAEKTNISFLAAINGESYRNYTQIFERPYITSTTVREVPNWRTASDAYVAYMLDPRNYLNEQNIFAFETLSYDSAFHTKNAVRSIVDGTYLDTDTYASYFIEGAKKYNVSPVHLASRVKQEGGTNSRYDSVSGQVKGTCKIQDVYVCSSYATITNTTNKTAKFTRDVNLRYGAGTNYSRKTSGLKGETFTLISTKKYKGSGCSAGWYRINSISRSLKGMYNYYNIGAYGANPVQRGLQTAAGCVDENDGTPWNSRKKAIVYGANFIANGYVNQGQDTMYYQKFNTSPRATLPKFTHQYMTNILAPAGESLSTYESYSNLKLINKPYVFKIPVYTNMPTNSTTHPQF